MSLLSSLFKTQKTPSYQGQKPDSSLLQGVGGQQYYNTLQDRIAGRGVGYGDNYASYANPQIAQMKNDFSSYQLPELQSELSATGRRSGSGGFAQIAKAYQNEGLNENALYGQLMQRNAEASHTDVNNAISGLGDFNQRDVNTQANAANFDNSLYGQQSRNIQADNAYNQQTAGNVLTGAVELGAAPFTGGASLGMGGFSNPFSGGSPSINYGGQQYATSQPPYGYNLSGMKSQNVARLAQRGGY